MTVKDVRGHGRQKGHTAVYRGKEYAVSLLRRLKSKSSFRTVSRRRDPRGGGSSTNWRNRCGRVSVMPVDQGYNIRTAERDVNEAAGAPRFHGSAPGSNAEPHVRSPDPASVEDARRVAIRDRLRDCRRRHVSRRPRRDVPLGSSPRKSWRRSSGSSCSARSGSRSTRTR